MSIGTAPERVVTAQRRRESEVGVQRGSLLSTFGGWDELWQTANEPGCKRGRSRLMEKGEEGIPGGDCVIRYGEAGASLDGPRVMRGQCMWK